MESNHQPAGWPGFQDRLPTNQRSSPVWVRMDLNHRSSCYEHAAFNRLATHPSIVLSAGVEPADPGLKGRWLSPIRLREQRGDERDLNSRPPVPQTGALTN